MYTQLNRHRYSPQNVVRPLDLSELHSIATPKPRPTFSTFPFTISTGPLPRLPFSVISDTSDIDSTTRLSATTLPLEHSNMRPRTTTTFDNTATTTIGDIGLHDTSGQDRDISLATKKKYKPVALKVRPVLGELPAKFRIIRNITGDPLEKLPELNPNPPPFVPCGRYTQERKDLFDKLNPGFLLPAERDLLHHFMMLHQDAFAWDDSERGHFREDFFPPVDMPVVPHTPWVLRNIPIPPGLYDQVCSVIQRKIAAGVFEPSNSSYWSRWFCVVKKDGRDL